MKKKICQIALGSLLGFFCVLGCCTTQAQAKPGVSVSLPIKLPPMRILALKK